MKKTSKKPIPPVKPKKQNVKSKQTTVRAPVARASVIRNSEPLYHNGRPGCILVSKSEYVTEVIASTDTFKIANTFPLNIGNLQLFPWASQMSDLYESYVFRKLSFHFRTESPTSQIGYVGLVVDYNPLDPPPTTKVAAMDFEESVRSAPWIDFDHVCGQKNLNKRKSYFSRGSTEATVTEPGLYDTGTLYVIVGGNTNSGASLGELWVDYTVEFITPELESGVVGLDAEVSPAVVGTTVLGYVSNDATAVTAPKTVDPYGNSTFVGGNFSVAFQSQTNLMKGNDVPIFQDVPEVKPPGAFFVAGNGTVYNSEPTVPRNAFVLLPNTTYVVEYALRWLGGYSDFTSAPTFDIAIDANSTITFITSLNSSDGIIVSASVTTGLEYGLAGFLLGNILLGATSYVSWQLTAFIRRRSGGSALVPASMVSMHEMVKALTIMEGSYRHIVGSGLFTRPKFLRPPNRATSVCLCEERSTDGSKSLNSETCNCHVCQPPTNDKVLGEGDRVEVPYHNGIVLSHPECWEGCTKCSRNSCRTK